MSGCGSCGHRYARKVAFERVWRREVYGSAARTRRYRDALRQRAFLAMGYGRRRP